MMIVETLSRDVRNALRSLRRDLGAALLVIVIAGLGIGASTTVRALRGDVGTAVVVIVSAGGGVGADMAVFGRCGGRWRRPQRERRRGAVVWIASRAAENLSARTVQVNNWLDLRAAGRWFV